MADKKLPKKSTELVYKEYKEGYLHWKHRTFGKKPEETKEDVEYRQKVQHLVDEHSLLASHWQAIECFFRESNRLMTQNEVLA
mgnify:CR=1 FL=1